MAGDIGAAIVLKPGQSIRVGDTWDNLIIKRIIRIEDRNGVVVIICKCKHVPGFIVGNGHGRKG